MNEISAIPSGATKPENEEGTLPPHHTEAEQQLLGAILTNNDVYDRVAQIIKPEHFYEPVHARIFEIAAQRISKNALASPVTLKAFMEDDEGLKELGGPAYLARLAGGAAISSFAARDYAQMIYEMAVRRELIQLGGDIQRAPPRWKPIPNRPNRSSPPNRRFTNWPNRVRQPAALPPSSPP